MYHGKTQKSESETRIYYNLTYFLIYIEAAERITARPPKTRQMGSEGKEDTDFCKWEAMGSQALQGV